MGYKINFRALAALPPTVWLAFGFLAIVIVTLFTAAIWLAVGLAVVIIVALLVYDCVYGGRIAKATTGKLNGWIWNPFTNFVSRIFGKKRSVDVEMNAQASGHVASPSTERVIANGEVIDLSDLVESPSTDGSFSTVLRSTTYRPTRSNSVDVRELDLLPGQTKRSRSIDRTRHSRRVLRTDAGTKLKEFERDVRVAEWRAETTERNLMEFKAAGVFPCVMANLKERHQENLDQLAGAQRRLAPLKKEVAAEAARAEVKEQLPLA